MDETRVAAGKLTEWMMKWEQDRCFNTSCSDISKVPLLDPELKGGLWLGNVMGLYAIHQGDFVVDVVISMCPERDMPEFVLPGVERFVYPLIDSGSDQQTELMRKSVVEIPTSSIDASRKTKECMYTAWRV